MLPLAERLRANAQFQQVFAEGRSFGDGAGLLALHVLRRPDDEATRQCGFTVSKKVGNAVTRNHVKRRLRESYRARLAALDRGYWAVVVARAKASEASFDDLDRSLDRALAKAGLLTASEPPKPASDAP